MIAAESPASVATDPQEVLSLAEKLVGLAREQLDCLTRGSMEQYQWLVLRRDEVMATLTRAAGHGVELTPDEFQRVEGLRDELAKADQGMEVYVTGRLQAINQQGVGLKKSRKLLS